MKLPVGAVKPQGWLRKQMELMADGFTGRLGELSAFLEPEGNAWLDPQGRGTASFWEELPYWLKGYGDLGYLLGDERIIRDARCGSNRPSPASAVTAISGRDRTLSTALTFTAARTYGPT